ncbi:MAG: hypothetical protein K2K91_03915 [Ruminococcus sp.]|nr:hypothetical protein [Ruminococcus sp.]
MKKKDLYDALSGIDEKYISDSENFSEISAEFKRAKIKKISTISSLCGCLLILSAVFLNSDVMDNNFNNDPELIEKSDTIQTDISDSSNVSEIIVTTDDKTKIQNITEITENNSEISSECLTSTENSDISDNSNITNENTVVVSKKTITTDVSDIGVIPVTDMIITTDYDNMTDGYDKVDFSGISVDEWLNNPDVIWGETDTKGYLNSEYISPGNTKISEKLSDLMLNNSNDAVYALMVDFSSCIDENELLNWKYNDNTIADLKLQISEITEYSENSYTYIDSDGIEQVEYFLTSESEKKVMEMERRINEIKSAYRDAKIQEFRYTFHDNGLEIYADRISGIQEENLCFYTFATKKHLEEFKCKNNEAFIFYSANYFK